MEMLILSHPFVLILVLFIGILLVFYKFVLRTFLKSFEPQLFSSLQSSASSEMWVPSTEIPDLVSGEFVDELKLDHLKFRREIGKKIDCAVCLLEFEEGEDIAVLKCKHVFHRNCLNKWLVYRQFTCPLCRSSLLPEKMASKQQELLERQDHTLVFQVSSFHDNSLRATWWFG